MSARSAVRALTVLLLLAAFVLAVVLVRDLTRDPGDRAAVGDVVPLRVAPYGQETEVLAPGWSVRVRVAEATTSLDGALRDGPEVEPLAAPEDGALLPVAGQAVGGGGLTAEDREDAEPVVVALVVDGERIELEDTGDRGADDLVSRLDWRSAAVALGQDADAVSLDDVTVEVTFDGLTQTVDVATGEVDTGSAALLYAPVAAIDTGCPDVQDRCGFVARGSGLTALSGTVAASDLALVPYLEGLGWAEPGRAWAVTRLSVFAPGAVVDGRGRSFFPRSLTAPVARLDGVEAVRSELGGEGTDYFFGNVVFDVDADTPPRDLRVDAVAPLPPGAPVRRVPLTWSADLGG